MRVLFIGNSYTYFNDLPELLMRFAAANGERIEAESVTAGGMTLLGHLRTGEAVSRIRSGGWDMVVLQEQSTRPITAPGLMYAASRELAGEVVSVGARTALYLTWARRDAPEQQLALNSAYYECAGAVRASIIPVGPCWQQVLADRPAIALYHEDGSHPAPLGTYLAACVFYAALTGRNPEGMAVRTVRAGDGEVYAPVELAVANTAFLQRKAWETASSFHPVVEQGAGVSDWGLQSDLEPQLLYELPLLRGLSPTDADEVLSKARRLRVPTGTRIFSEGEQGDTAYIVVDGEIRLAMSTGYDDVFAPWRMGIVVAAEARSLLGEPYGCTLAAVTDVTALALDRSALDSLAVERPELARALRRNIASE